MAKKGDIIKSGETGDVVEFLETASDTGGKYTKIKITVRAGGFKPVEHIHPQIDETFRILDGKLTYMLAGEKHVISPGQQITLPRGIKHTHFNNETEDLVMEQIFTPSLDVEVFLENLFGLTFDGKFKETSPSILQIMVWLRKLKAKTYLAKIPVGVQKALSYVLAPIGGLFGYKASYAKYNGIEL